LPILINWGRNWLPYLRLLAIIGIKDNGDDERGWLWSRWRLHYDLWLLNDGWLLKVLRLWSWLGWHWLRGELLFHCLNRLDLLLAHPHLIKLLLATDFINNAFDLVKYHLLSDLSVLL
jgi:hypothetical protein